MLCEARCRSGYKGHLQQINRHDSETFACIKQNCDYDFLPKPRRLAKLDLRVGVSPCDDPRKLRLCLLLFLMARISFLLGDVFVLASKLKGSAETALDRRSCCAAAPLSGARAGEVVVSILSAGTGGMSLMGDESRLIVPGAEDIGVEAMLFLPLGPPPEGVEDTRSRRLPLEPDGSRRSDMPPTSPVDAVISDGPDGLLTDDVWVDTEEESSRSPLIILLEPDLGRTVVVRDEGGSKE